MRSHFVKASHTPARMNCIEKNKSKMLELYTRVEILHHACMCLHTYRAKTRRKLVNNNDEIKSDVPDE